MCGNRNRQTQAYIPASLLFTKQKQASHLPLESGVMYREGIYSRAIDWNLNVHLCLIKIMIKTRNAFPLQNFLAYDILILLNSRGETYESGKNSR